MGVVSTSVDDTSVMFGDVAIPGVPCVTALLDYSSALIAQADYALAVQLAVQRCEGRAEGFAACDAITHAELAEVELAITAMANSRLLALTGRQA